MTFCIYVILSYYIFAVSGCSSAFFRCSFILFFLYCSLVVPGGTYVHYDSCVNSSCFIVPHGLNVPLYLVDVLLVFNVLWLPGLYMFVIDYMSFSLVKKMGGT